MAKPWRGLFNIMNTPFDSSGNVIWSDLERLCDFVSRAGSHGVVWPVNDSEFSTLSFSERVEGFTRVVGAVNKRIPVMLCVADTSTQGAIAYAEAAAKAGADAVIAMPPWHTKLGTHDQIVGYYRSVAVASGLPVCIQNFGAPMGADLSPDAIFDICQKVPSVRYIKEERAPQGDWVSAVINRQVPGLTVWGGGVCFSMIALHRRGAAGNVASSGAPDVHARVWDLMEAGKEDEAQRIQLLLNDLMRTELSTQSLHGVKTCFVLRGLWSSALMRNSTPRTLDKHYMRELERCLDQLAPYLVKV